MLVNLINQNNNIDIKPWYPLRLLSLYRIFIAILLAALHLSGISQDTLGVVNQELFTLSSSIYVLFSLVLFIAQRIKIPAYYTQAYTQISGDIIFITLMMHSSGGVSSGLGILLIVSIAGASLLFSNVMGFLFAAVASIAILAVQVYSHISIGITAYSYSQTGTLGAALFGTAALVAFLNRRVRETEALASQRELDLANLSQLNEHIIQQMQNGVIVVDTHLNVRLINKSAQEFLSVPYITLPTPLEVISKPLLTRLNLWLVDKNEKPNKIREPGSPFEVQPYFTALGQNEEAGTLVILEDISSYTRALQDAKLASLGRLTASIAHEIRNPLSAIQHASQLLDESPHVYENDKRLIEIINKQSHRMNTVIENVTQLSSKDKIIAEPIHLKKWLENFKQDFCKNREIDESKISLQIDPDHIMIKMDPTQLHQVLWNLCTNSLKYGLDDKGNLKIKFKGYIEDLSKMIYLEISDTGPGIPQDIQEHIFEPFYTISNNSSGLGLYIARELCEFNGANISYIQTKSGCMFRVTFAGVRNFEL